MKVIDPQIQSFNNALNYLPSVPMDTFLSHIANKLLSEFGNDMSKVYVVFPNRRAGRFLKKELVARSNATILAPKVTSIEDLIREMSGLDILDANTLILRFYEVYKRVSKADDTTLKQFLRWAPTYLTDIDEIDLEMADANSVFADLHSAKRIESWEMGEGGITEFQQRHLDHVAKFSAYYCGLKDELARQGQAFRGMAYREVADLLSSEGLPKPVNQIWFAGFNALYEAEEIIISTLIDSGIGRVVFDADQAYLNDPVNEAGKFLRKYQNDRCLSGGFNEIGENLNKANRSVHVVPVTGSVMQAQVATNILKQVLENPGSDPVRTAIVLNDTNLLFPLLSNLPTGKATYNLTMGYPFQASAIARFVDQWLTYQVQASRSGSVHHRIVKQLLIQPIAKKLIGASEGFKQQIGNKVYVSISKLIEGAPDRSNVRLLFGKAESSKEALVRLEMISQELGKHNGNESALGVEMFLPSFEKMILDLKRFVDVSENLGVADLQLLWSKLKKQTQIPFEGEPLEGIQIMGMLETRVLDFDNVIMLGVNEGTLPSNSDSPSYLPYDIRIRNGMRTDLDKDAVASYHFQRLMQRCANAYLIYDSDADSPMKGEASRFIAQLTNEPWENTVINELTVTSEVGASAKPAEISIQKTDFELRALARYFERGISPSGLNQYLTCKLKFYYQYVLKLGEPDELSESLDFSEFGTIVHNTLDDLYKDFIAEGMTVNRLKEKQGKIESTLKKEFLKTMEHLDEISGRDLLSVKVAETYVNRVLIQDIAYLEKFGAGALQMRGVEIDGNVELNVSLPQPFTRVRLAGRIDRIDELSDGTIRVLDYKTGKVDAEDLALSSIDELTGEKGRPKAAQLVLYGLMMQQHEQGRNYQFGIATLQSSKPPVLLSINKQTSFTIDDVRNMFRPVITSQVLEMADPEVAFTQTEDLKACGYCQYASICNR